VIPDFGFLGPPIAVGDRYLLAWAPAASHWPNLFLNGADLLALRVLWGSDPDGVPEGPSADTSCRTRKAGRNIVP